MKTPRNESDKQFPQSDIAAAASDGPWTEAPVRVSRGPLVPCPSCKRHVFASTELTCPFCLAALPADLAQRAAPSTARRMSRGDVFYFNARNVDANALDAVAGGVGLNQFGPAPAAEQGSNYGTGLGIGNWGELGGDHGGTVSAYGSPVPGLGGGFEPYHPGEDPGGGAAMYGAPADPGQWDPHPGFSPGDPGGEPGGGSDPGFVSPWGEPGGGESHPTEPGQGGEPGGGEDYTVPDYGGSEYGGLDNHGGYEDGGGGFNDDGSYGGGGMEGGGEFNDGGGEYA